MDNPRPSVKPHKNNREFQMRCIKKMLKVSWIDKLINEDALQTAQILIQIY